MTILGKKQMSEEDIKLNYIIQVIGCEGYRKLKKIANRKF